MTLYLETSDLVKLYVDEPGSDAVVSLVGAADVVVTSALAYPEARAAFRRQRAERLLSPAECRMAVARLDADWPRFVVFPVDADIAQAAGRLADTHAIRGADAVHLAAFEALVGTCSDHDIRFSSADVRLTRAARQLG